jgi:SynChlorMet cassette radical SAM/SPASM protein ScmE
MKSKMVPASEKTREIMKTPRKVKVSITGKCNLRCAYCCHFSSSSDAGRDLITEEWLVFFEELGRAAVMEVDIAGGEPFLRPDLSELLNGIVRNGMRFSIISNGFLITDEIAEHIAKTGRCKEIIISVDGKDAHTNDPFRGNGSFDGALKGIEVLKNHEIPVSVSMTAHKKNVNLLDSIIIFFLEQLKLFRVYTGNVALFGLARKNASTVTLDSMERSTAMEALVDLKKIYGNRLSDKTGPLAKVKYWLSLEQLCKQDGEKIPHCGRLSACENFFQSVSVRSDGAIIPCNFMPDIVLGDIKNQNFIDVWQNSSELNQLRQRDNQRTEELEFCSGCKYVKYCTGGCPALAYVHFSDIYKPDPEGCLRTFLENGGTLPKEATESAQYM